jgi:sugar lactone lactonase YvrE
LVYRQTGRLLPRTDKPDDNARTGEMFMRNRLNRMMLALLTVSLISLGLIGALSVLSRPAPELAQPAPMKLKLAMDKLTKLSFARPASAAELDGRLDTVADVLFGQPDFSTGDAPITATAANLNAPGDLFVYDLTGQLFMADTAHNRVLIWDSVDFYEQGDPADVVLGQPDFETTEALDPPTDASMNAPKGVTVGFDGLIYVSDTGNNRVLVFFPINYPDDDYFPGESYPIFENGQEADYVLGQSDFETSAAQPTGPGSLNRPHGIVTDVKDNLVVADTGNNRVLIWEWSNAGTIGPNANWVVGQGNTGEEIFTLNAAPDPPTQSSMNGPTGVAADTLGRAIYVADTGNNRILLFTSDPLDTIADGVIGQPDYVSNAPNNGGVSATSLNHPTGLKMDAGSRLFVADSHNHRVLAFDLTVTEGTADAVFGQADFTGNTANNGGISASSLYTPTGIATDSLYMNVYIADAGNQRVLQYNQPLQNPLPVIAELNPGTVPPGLTDFSYLDRGYEGYFELAIWGSGIISDTVIEVNGVARSTGGNFLGLSYTEIEASEVVTTGVLTINLRNPGPGGGVSNVFALEIYEPVAGDDQADSVIGQQGFTSNDGTFGRISAETLSNPSGMVIDPETGRIFVADTGNARVLSWPSQEAQTLGGAADLVIGKPDFVTYFYDDLPGLNLIRPVGLALDSGGNLYVTDAEEHLVLVYSAPFTNNMPATLILGGFNNPIDLALDSQDNLYVADTFNHRVLYYEKPLSSGDITPNGVFGQPDMNSRDPNAGATSAPRACTSPAVWPWTARTTSTSPTATTTGYWSIWTR